MSYWNGCRNKIINVIGDGQVTITGGTKVTTQWTKEGEIWRTQLNTSVENWRFDTLWVNGKRAVLARSPDEWKFARTLGFAQYNTSDENTKKHVFTISEAGVKYLHDLSHEEMLDVIIVDTRKWCQNIERISEYDLSKRQIITYGVATPSCEMQTNDMYYLQNLRTGLDNPGEWFLSRSGVLSYYPLPTEIFESSNVIYSTTSSLLSINQVNNVKIENIRFAYAAKPVNDEEAPGSSYFGCTIYNSKNIIITGCSFEHFGMSAINFRSDDSVISDNYIYDLGQTGISFNGFNVTVQNNIIRGGGRVNHKGNGLSCWGQGSFDNIKILNNDISDFLYTGIGFGVCNGIDCQVEPINFLVEKNHVHHLGYNIMSDMGCIYWGGMSTGTIIRNNWVHDIGASSYGAQGIYPDEGAWGALIEDNIVHDVLDGSFHLHYGHSFVIQNNIFAMASKRQIALTRQIEKPKIMTFKNNIVVYDSGDLLSSTIDYSTKFDFDNNIYWRIDNVNVSFNGDSLATRQSKGQDQNSFEIDPLFESVERRDFRFKSNESLTKINFKPFDLSLIGVQGTDSWKNKAKDYQYHEFITVLPYNQLNYHENMENGETEFLKSFSKNVGSGSIALSNEAAHSGKYSLKIVDANNNQASYIPYFIISPKYYEGEIKLSFWLKMGTGASMSADMRTNNKAGPIVYVTESEVYSTNGKRILTDLDKNQWVKIEMTTWIGSLLNMSFAIKATQGSKSGSINNFNITNKEWSKVESIVFNSNAKEKVEWFIDDIELTAPEALVDEFKDYNIENDDGGLTTGEIAGIVVVVLVFVAIATISAFIPCCNLL
ncbi:putative secreted protein [Histomonas meleagridis]|uniref:uncharacterized protein n=1 Tax=Histomonas meleagridis TaxID=135588 RepID=UPI00355AA4A2|nr:putative secreted protein [Histomonas meleagridis]KAH0804979.1 putative secreted protein [Histomonas meleagridis]